MAEAFKQWLDAAADPSGEVRADQLCDNPLALPIDLENYQVFQEPTKTPVAPSKFKARPSTASARIGNSSPASTGHVLLRLSAEAYGKTAPAVLAERGYHARSPSQDEPQKRRRPQSARDPISSSATGADSISALDDVLNVRKSALLRGSASLGQRSAHPAMGLFSARQQRKESWGKPANPLPPEDTRTPEEKLRDSILTALAIEPATPTTVPVRQLRMSAVHAIPRPPSGKRSRPRQTESPRTPQVMPALEPRVCDRSSNYVLRNGFRKPRPPQELDQDALGVSGQPAALHQSMKVDSPAARHPRAQDASDPYHIEIHRRSARELRELAAQDQDMDLTLKHLKISSWETDHHTDHGPFQLAHPHTDPAASDQSAHVQADAASEHQPEAEPHDRHAGDRTPELAHWLSSGRPHRRLPAHPPSQLPTIADDEEAPPAESAERLQPEALNLNAHSETKPEPPTQGHAEPEHEDQGASSTSAALSERTPAPETSTDSMQIVGAEVGGLTGTPGEMEAADEIVEAAWRSFVAQGMGMEEALRKIATGAVSQLKSERARTQDLQDAKQALEQQVYNLKAEETRRTTAFIVSAQEYLRKGATLAHELWEARASASIAESKLRQIKAKAKDEGLMYDFNTEISAILHSLMVRWKYRAVRAALTTWIERHQQRGRLDLMIARRAQAFRRAAFEWFHEAFDRAKEERARGEFAKRAASEHEQEMIKVRGMEERLRAAEGALEERRRELEAELSMSGWEPGSKVELALILREIRSLTTENLKLKQQLAAAQSPA